MRCDGFRRNVCRRRRRRVRRMQPSRRCQCRRTTTPCPRSASAGRMTSSARRRRCDSHCSTMRCCYCCANQMAVGRSRMLPCSSPAKGTNRMCACVRIASFELVVICRGRLRPALPIVNLSPSRCFVLAVMRPSGRRLSGWCSQIPALAVAAPPESVVKPALSFDSHRALSVPLATLLIPCTRNAGCRRAIAVMRCVAERIGEAKRSAPSRCCTQRATCNVQRATCNVQRAADHTSADSR